MHTFTNLYLDIIVKTVVACLLSGFIGMERQLKDRPAGFRTHILVCLGATSVMILSESVLKNNYELYGAYADPFRLGAQVISGVGFLGAGTILHQGTGVKGLTTAASLWLVAILGLVIGMGGYFLAVTMFIAIYITLFIFNTVSRKFVAHTNALEIMLEIINNPKTLGAINFIIGHYGGQIVDLKFLENEENLKIPNESEQENDQKIIVVRFMVKLPNNSQKESMIKEMEAVYGVVKAELV